jgi:cell volume regulation protein A
MTLDFWNGAFFVGALLLVIAIVSSAVSARFGAPLVLAFIVLGMLAGEEGPGGIPFDDFEVSYVIGSLALAVIIFDGGLRTRRDTFRVALWPSVSLATVGVLFTAGLVGAFAAWILGIGWTQGMLLGAIVGSTDAAAVFSVLRSSGIRLKERVAATLEIESASNDPMAIFLTIALLELLVANRQGFEAGVVLSFVKQFGIGTLLGIAGGRLLVWVINRLALQSGLYPLLAAAGGILVFSVTQELGGSGYLAIFLAGIVLGNAELQAGQDIQRVHDGLAWLSQIVMFVILGLLVTPSRLLPIAAPAIAIVGFLILVARPLAVVLSLAPFRFPWREQGFIGWVGLRGAVPVVLALFPFMYGAEDARLYFDVTFFLVLASLVLQGWTVSPAARLFGVEVPPSTEPAHRVTLDMPGHYEHEILSYEVPAGSFAAEHRLGEIELPGTARIVAVMRDGAPQALDAGLALQPGDYVHLLSRPKNIPALNRLFDPHRGPERLDERRYFGDFVLNGDAVLGDLGAIYGFDVPAEHAGHTLAEYLDRRSHGRVVVGDRAPLGTAQLVVREMQDGRVTRVGLKIRRA